jgi:N6-adenosine-specific RNA methylase IME4
MLNKDLLALGQSIKPVSANNSILYLWVTDWNLEFAVSELMPAWGYKYKTVGFVWAKTTKNQKWHIGLGYYTRANPEMCLIGVKGKGVPVVNHGVRRLQVHQISKHSKKPDEIYQNIRLLHGERNYLELFARQSRLGYTVLGNEIDGQHIENSLVSLSNI